MENTTTLLHQDALYEMIPVNSSNIKGLAYNWEKRTLIVWFWVGSIYAYNPIQPNIFEALRAADSIGKYFNENIKVNKLVDVVTIANKPLKK